jgi:hypothetical protein
MPYQLWSQDNFSKGELSPYMYARAQVIQYFDGLKTAQNVLTYPTGAAGKRFGTLYQASLSNITAANQLYFQTFQYLDICVYQLVFTPLLITIYLEGIQVAVVTTTLDALSVYNLSTTTLGAAFRAAGAGFEPYDLTVTLDSGTTISGITGNEFTFGSAIFTAGKIVPVQFTTTGTLPTTNPQIKVGVTYFVNPSSTTAAFVYSTAYEAKFNISHYTITAATGSGTNKLFILNTWSWANPTLENFPVYDFTGGYNAMTFTPGAVSGTGVTLTASGGAPFTSAYVGGGFFGNGGIARIIGYTDTTHVTLDVFQNFDDINGIPGSLSLLAEPAWSNARGWPQKVSSYQNRALFANTVSLPNGFWTSVINNYNSLSNLTTDDDDGISWYPSSNDVNVIRFIVPFRSITVHTNSGIYSSPLSEISAITPNTFTLQLQDSTPADVLQPQAIDNQIIVLSGNDVHTLLWDGINNAYTSNIVSVVSEQVIREPVDETSFADLRRAGSRYVFIINANGSMAVYQTLQSENVSGFTPQIMEQSYGDAQFLQVASSFDGRCWFVVQRQYASQGSGISITAYSAYSAGPPVVLSTLTATSSSFDLVNPTAITFTTSGTLPATIPALATGTYYWAIGVTADTFNVYLDQSDAMAGINALQFTSAGTSSDVVPWPLATVFTLEELTQKTYLDCALYYNASASPTSTFNTGELFNAQQVNMVGDGFGYSTIAVGNSVTFEAHGSPVNVSMAYIGFPINTIMEPMPIALPEGSVNSLTKPTHIRSVRFMFNNTIGGTINGVPIALNQFDQANIGDPPFPSNGIFEMSIMSGWDDFNKPSFTIEHSDPFNIELIGIFYSVEV